MIDPEHLKANIKQYALRAGFDLTGVAPCLPPPNIKTYKHWIAQGFHGDMLYLARHAEKKENPKLILPSLESIIVFGVSYNTQTTKGTEKLVARFARFEDYHKSIKKKMKEVAGYILSIYPTFDCRIYVDTGPVIERDYAWLSGLGFYGKNCCIISPEFGSFFFIGTMLTNLPLTPDNPIKDGCNTCDLCIKSCPTRALSAGHPGMLDAGKCLSYLTIEYKEDKTFNNEHTIAGCDICQSICPHNINKPLHNGKILKPFKIEKSLEELQNLSEDEFKTIFKKTPIARVKPEGLKRNIKNHLLTKEKLR